MPGGFALAPKRLTRARPIATPSRRQSFLHGFPVHPSQRQRLAAVVSLGNGGRAAKTQTRRTKAGRLNHGGTRNMHGLPKPSQRLPPMSIAIEPAKSKGLRYRSSRGQRCVAPQNRPSTGCPRRSAMQCRHSRQAEGIGFLSAMGLIAKQFLHPFSPRLRIQRQACDRTRQ